MAKKKKEPKLTKSQFDRALSEWRNSLDERLAAEQRRLDRLVAAKRGEAQVTVYWREPYSEKKIRSYEGTFVTRTTIRKPKPVTKTKKGT